MIPILYNSDESRFVTNGLGRLSDCIRAVVTEERNGIYELEFDYPITGAHFDEIALGKIVACTHDEKGDIQPFVVYARSVPDLNGIVTFNAHHISYRLSDVVVGAYTASSVAQALDGISTNSVNSNPFEFWTDKTTTGEFTNDVPRLARNMLGGEQNSVLDVYGGGDYEFDRFTVKLHAHRGTDSGVEIRWAKNLTALNQTLDDSGTYNAVLPYWTNDEETVIGDRLIIASDAETQVANLADHNQIILRTETNAPLEAEYMYLDAAPMDLSSEFESKPTQYQLRTKARTRFERSGAWVADENITVDFVQLWQTEEYAEYAPLQRVGLCDTVSVYYPQVGIEAVKQRVVKVAYNVLLDRYDSIELGTPQVSLSTAIRSDVMQDVVTPSMMDSAVNYATDLIRGGLGGYVVMTPGSNGYPQEILILDRPNINTAVNVWRFNRNGLGHSSSGYEGPYSDIALTADGRINASMITTGSLSANRIKAGILSDNSGENYWNLSSGVLSTQRGYIGPFSVYSDQLRFQTDTSQTLIYSSFSMRRRSNFVGESIYRMFGTRLTGGSIYFYLADDGDFETVNNKVRIYLSKGSNTGIYGFTIADGESGDLTATFDGPGSNWPIWFYRSVGVAGNFTVNGTKNRRVETDNYSDRLLYCYETPTPLFGDIGEAVIDEDGFAYVDIDDIFSEAIADKVEYQVFLQKEGEGDCWISEKNPRYFTIQGTPNLKVAWELKAKQKDYEMTRLEQAESNLDEYEYRYDNSTLDDFITEREALLYGNN